MPNVRALRQKITAGRGKYTELHLRTPPGASRRGSKGYVEESEALRGSGVDSSIGVGFRDVWASRWKGSLSGGTIDRSEFGKNGETTRNGRTLRSSSFMQLKELVK